MDSSDPLTSSYMNLMDIPDVDDVLRQMKRVLRSGGFLHCRLKHDDSRRSVGG